MQSVQPMTKKKQDYVSLCFDIDGCLTMLVPSCKKMPSFYKDALLEKIKTIVFPQLGKQDSEYANNLAPIYQS